jgi:hypothetical protein
MDDKTMSVLEIHYQHKAHHLFDLKFVATRSRSCVYRHPMLDENQNAEVEIVIKFFLVCLHKAITGLELNHQKSKQARDFCEGLMVTPVMHEQTKPEVSEWPANVPQCRFRIPRRRKLQSVSPGFTGRSIVLSLSLPASELLQFPQLYPRPCAGTCLFNK